MDLAKALLDGSGTNARAFWCGTDKIPCVPHWPGLTILAGFPMKLRIQLLCCDTPNTSLVNEINRGEATKNTFRGRKSTGSGGRVIHAWDP